MSAEGVSRVRGHVVGLTGEWEIAVVGGRIASVSAVSSECTEEVRPACWIGPTLFDIQVNGGFGIDLQHEGIGADALYRLSAALAAHGVSRWVPTLITGPPDRLLRGCRAIAEALEDPRLRRHIPGIHLEGPFISPEDGPRGAHAREHVRPPDAAEFDRLYDAAGGCILYVTIAPELPGAAEFVAHCVARGVVVALGHHLASADAIAQAADAGATLCTHLGNGVSALLPRHHNPLWPQLADDRLSASFIADLHHLPPPVLKSFVRAKGPDRTVLVSDAVPPAGLAPGRYRLAEVDVELQSGGLVRLAGSDLLAGSGLMLLQGVVNASRVTDLSLEAAFSAATTNPSKLLGVPAPTWPPQAGDTADFVVFDVDRDGAAHVRNVFLQGEATAVQWDALWRDQRPCDGADTDWPK